MVMVKIFVIGYMLKIRPDAIYSVLQNGNIGETYNIGGNNEIKNIDIVHSICTIMNETKPRSCGKDYEELIIFVKDRPGHDYRYAIDDQRLKKTLGA